MRPVVKTEIFSGHSRAQRRRIPAHWAAAWASGWRCRVCNRDVVRLAWVGESFRRRRLWDRGGDCPKRAPCL